MRRVPRADLGAGPANRQNVIAQMGDPQRRFRWMPSGQGNYGKAGAVDPDLGASI